jgi:hypothetical protein
MIEKAGLPAVCPNAADLTLEQRTPVSFIGVTARIAEGELLFLPLEPELR